jgi:hypothetical protein
LSIKQDFLLEQEQKELKRWEQIRRIGKWPYVFIYGSLLWGLTSAFVSTAIMVFWYQGVELRALVATLASRQFLFQCLLFLLLGWFVGSAMWYFNERKFKEQ